jgi:hypothetical protein
MLCARATSATSAPSPAKWPQSSESENPSPGVGPSQAIETLIKSF